MDVYERNSTQFTWITMTVLNNDRKSSQHRTREHIETKAKIRVKQFRSKLKIAWKRLGNNNNNKYSNEK